MTSPYNRSRPPGACSGSWACSLGLAWALAPFLWSIRNSIMLLEDTYKPLFIPFLQFTPTLQTWRFELIEQTVLTTALGRSLIVACCHLLIVIPLGTLAGFALGRFQYRRPDNFNLTMWFLSQRFLPPAVIIIPYLLMMRAACDPIALPFGLWLPQPLQLVCVLEGDRSLLNTLSAITLAHVTFNLPFVILIMRSIFAEMPREIEEAARIDGAHRLADLPQDRLAAGGPGHRRRHADHLRLLVERVPVRADPLRARARRPCRC